ncbi:terminase large subunit domain-containing protein [Gynuella sp.]|uniref:terminase large subunit domain-containing protein n=1 Tax=Gynuella sp. TaxID=2969146 RepID=UPI003D11E4EE
MSEAILLPYQVRWIEDESPVKIIEKSRRIGLSYAEAAAAVLHASAASGANVYYISFNKDMTQGFISDCAEWAKKLNAAAGKINESIMDDDDKQVLKFELKFDSGNMIQAFSSNPRNLRSKGRPGEILIIDESAFVDDQDELLKSAMAMTMWGGKIHIISTHNGADNPFNLLIEDCRAGLYDHSVHRVTLDDAIHDGLFKRICQITKQAWTLEKQQEWRASLINRYKPNEDEELFCIPAKSSGAWLPRALIKERMKATTPVLRITAPDGFVVEPEKYRRQFIQDWLEQVVEPTLARIPKEAEVYVGEDFGRSGDLTVLTIAFKLAGITLKVGLMIELRDMPFDQQEQIVFFVLDFFIRFMGAAFDARGNGQSLAEKTMQKYGQSRVALVMLSESWYRENMPPFKASMEDGTMDELPDDDDVMNDLRAIEVVNGVPRLINKRTTGADAGKRHGDSAISLVMAHYAAQTITKGPVTVSSRSRRQASTMFEGYQ